mmetsp:Transcript_19592/g.52957  ORF Transcript_19592/g.52957 Transcript_19592/m.52957 type:complete len:201 (-) Transcript_19592:1797-2399(-)
MAALERDVVDEPDADLDVVGEEVVELARHEDVGRVDLGRRLEAVRDLDLGREVGAVDLDVCADGALDGPSEVEAIPDDGRVLAVEKLDNLLVRVVRLQLGRHRDLSDAAAEGSERAVAHLRLGGGELGGGARGLIHVDVEDGLPNAQEGLAQVAVGLAAVVGDRVVHDDRRRVGEGQDLLAQALEHLLVVVNDAEAVRPE